jgi:replicative DNA helicase
VSDIPHNTEAEECVIGSMLLNNQGIEALSESMVSTDFYTTGHGLLFDTIVSMYTHGIKADVVTVTNALSQGGVLDQVGDRSTLAKLVSNTPSAMSARHYAGIVLDLSLRRRLMAEANELAHQARDMTLDVSDVLESHQSLVATLGSTLIDHEPDDIAVEDFMKLPKDKMSPWVVHGIIRRRHKVIIVGNEGSGKSWLCRFIAICAAYGIQPFRHDLVKPVRTLIVDAENPEDALYDSFEAILRKVTDFNPQSETVNRLWHRPQGMNLRNRVDLAELENVIRIRRPDLVCLGPLYAVYENSSKDFGWETAAREVQGVLKKLMVRYDFALMIEDHAPQADGAGKRVMRPYGSSFWRRWPDIGIGMEPLGSGDEESDSAFKLTRWRGDRVVTDWPKYIERGTVTNSPWPFLGRWE